MSDELYLRKVILKIIPQSGTGKQIENLRISFNVKKNSEGNPNEATIKIFNLSQNTRSILERPKNKVSLEAGYGDKTKLIFLGDIEKVIHKKEGTVDILSTIEAKDGGNQHRTAFISKGYPPGTTGKQILEDVMSLTSLNKGTVPEGQDKKFAHGISIEGLFRDSMDTITKSMNLKWSIQNEKIQVLGRGGANNEPPILMNSSTGLINSPGKTKEGIEFESLLNPDLVPGRRVKLDSLFIKGMYVVSVVTHDGDSQKGPNSSKCEAFSYGK